MRRTTFNIITIIFAIIYIGSLVLGNVFYTSIPIATEPGSYADQFATEKMLYQISVADTEKKYLDLRYETFDYNTTERDTLSIERYQGVSKDLMIPAFIGGVMVTTIGEHFFDGLELDSLILPETVVEIKAEPTDTITIYCDKDSQFYALNKDAEEWKIETVYDSTFYNGLCADIPFAYNDHGDSIELVRYTGKDKIIVIPSYINGKPVTTVSFNLLGRFDMVVFPKTVNEINGKVGAWIFSAVLVIEIFFTVLAFLVVIIAVNIILSRYKKDLNEYMLSGPQMIMSLAFLAIQIYLCFRYIYLVTISAGKAFVISAGLLLVYIIIVFALNRGRKHSKKVTAEVKEATASIRNLQSLVKGMDEGIEDLEIKKAVSRVIDEIRYTQAKSKDLETEEFVEEKITSLKRLIKDGRKEDIIAKCDDIIDLMKKR